MAPAKLKKGLVGITTYLRDTVLGGVPFTRCARGAGKSAGRGLWIGRTVDRQFTEYAEGRLQPSASRATHTRLCHIARALKRGGVHLVRGQFAVAAEKLGLKTAIDAVGVCGRDIVAIELKTTQHAYATHAGLYKRPCSKQPVLTNGLPNTEHTHHLLQAGFGAACMAPLADGCRVRAVVVVSYEDRAELHWVPPTHTRVGWFLERPSQPESRPRKKKAGKKKAELLVWPTCDPRLEPALHRAGARQIVRAGHAWPEFGALRVRGRTAAAACMTRLPAPADRAKMRARILKTARGIFKDVDKGTIPLAFVLAPGRNREWHLTKL